MRDRTAFGDAHALVGARRRHPDTAVAVQTDPIRYGAVRQISPCASVAQVAIGGDVERGQAAPPGFAYDQRLSVGRDHGSVWKGQFVGHHARRAIRLHADEFCLLWCCVGVQVESEVADVCSTFPINHHVVAVEACQLGEIRVRMQGAAVPAQQAPVGHGHHQQVAVRQPAQS